MITVEEKTFKVVAENECHKVVTVEPITRIIAVNNSIPGAKGDNATINGLNAINILAGENIELEQEDDTLTINATAPPQIQSDMAQTDETKADFIKNKDSDNIAFIMREDGKIIYQDTLTNFLMLIINDVINPIGDEISNLYSSKQNQITETTITINTEDWVNGQDNYEIRCVVSDLKDTDKVWYSPDVASIDIVADNEVYMKSYSTGTATFQAKYLPTESITMVIRRCD